MVYLCIKYVSKVRNESSKHGPLLNFTENMAHSRVFVHHVPYISLTGPRVAGYASAHRSVSWQLPGLILINLPVAFVELADVLLDQPAG